MTAIHTASRVDPSAYSEALHDLLDIAVDSSFIDYIVQCTVDAVEFAIASSSQDHIIVSSRTLASFKTFAENVIRRSRVQTPALLASLVYMNRGKAHLTIHSEEWACERIFLGALIVASKFLNDQSLHNVHWAVCTGRLGKRDVGRIEREFLDVLDWELGLSEADLLDHHQSITSLHRPHPPAPRHSTEKSQSFFLDDSEDSDSSASSSSPHTPCTIPSPPHQLKFFESPTSLVDFVGQKPCSVPMLASF